MGRGPEKRWIDYLTVVCGAVIVFAALMVVTRVITDGFFSWMIFGDWGVPDGFSEEAVDYYRLIYAITGAVMIGWFVLVTWVVRGPLAQGTPGAWAAIVASIGIWFVIDSAYSVLSGNWENAVLNTGFLLAFLPGLTATRPHPRR